MRTHDLPQEIAHEVVHRDDLVVLPSSGKSSLRRA
jgi:hypothetical protein